MADSEAFDLACEQLERGSSLDRLETRGTLRIALKRSGLEARSVTPAELAVVLTRVLPGELRSRNVENAEELCRRAAEALSQLHDDASEESPYAVFARLGRSR